MRTSGSTGWLVYEYRAYAECMTCNIGFAGSVLRVEDWADSHELTNKHRVEIHYNE